MDNMPINALLIDAGTDPVAAVAAHLQDQGCPVTVGADGTTACEALAERDYPLIVVSERLLADGALAQSLSFGQRRVHSVVVVLVDSHAPRTPSAGHAFEGDIRLDARSPTGWLVERIDAARRLAVRRLRRRGSPLPRDLFLSLVNHSHEAIFVIDPETAGFVEVNHQACRNLGYAKDELLDLTVMDIESRLPDHTDWAAMVERLRCGEAVLFGGWHRRKDGSLFPVEVSGKQVQRGDNAYIVAIARDLTEYKATREQLESSLSLLRATLESTADGILVVDSAGTLVTYNQKFQQMWGLDDATVNDREATLMHVAQQVNDPARFRATMRQIYAEPHKQSFDVVELRDGRVFERYSQPQRIAGQCVGRVWSFRDVTERARAERAVQASEEHFRQLIDNLSEIITILRLDGTIAYESPAIEYVLGYAQDELIGANVAEYVHPDDLPKVETAIAELAQGDRQVFCPDFRFRHRDGSWRVVESIGKRIEDYQGAPAVVATSRDITARKQAQALQDGYNHVLELLARDEDPAHVLRVSLELIEAHCPDTVAAAFVADREAGCWRLVCAPNLSQAQREQLDGGPLGDVAEPTPPDLASGPASREARFGAGEPGRYWYEPFTGEDGSLMGCLCVYPEFARGPDDAEYRVLGTVANFAGISLKRRRAQERLDYLAYHDPLTDRPNRTLFHDRLAHALTQAERAGHAVALVFIDLDNFKHINDSLGHRCGDLLLREVAARIAGCVRASDTVARLGGDEFGVVLEGIGNATAVAAAAQKLIDAFAEPFYIEGRELRVTVSAGVALYPTDSREVEHLIRDADTAMYRAKDLGRNSYRFYSPDMTAKSVELLSMRNELHRALEQGEFELHYQPIHEVASGEMVATESLLRWRHPQRGVLRPAEFLHVLEESGLVRAVGEQVLRDACHAHCNCQLPGRIYVNVSTVQLQDRNFVDRVKQVIDETGIDAERVGLEITETAVMDDIESGNAVLESLKALGLHLAIDDFGTGYSSLGRLKGLPIDMLKIDATFIRDIITSDTDAAMVSAIVAMAHRLRLKVVAEGVETEAQLEKVRDHGCDGVQGFLLARPVPAAYLPALVDERQRQAGG